MHHFRIPRVGARLTVRSPAVPTLLNSAYYCSGATPDHDNEKRWGNEFARLGYCFMLCTVTKLFAPERLHQ